MKIYIKFTLIQMFTLILKITGSYNKVTDYIASIKVKLKCKTNNWQFFKCSVGSSHPKRDTDDP